MPNTAIKLRQCWMHATIFLWFWLRTQQGVLAGNVTVLDTDASISYAPVGSWHGANDTACAQCLVPVQGASYHEAFRLGPGADTDESTEGQDTTPPVPGGGPNVGAADPSPSPAVTSAAPTSSQKVDTDGDAGPGGLDTDSSDSKKGKKRVNSRMFGRALLPVLRRDADDPVSLSFEFNGSAIYLFGYQPLGTSTQVPTNLNLTFSLDNQPSTTLMTQAINGDFGFTNKLLFSAVGLEGGFHQLVVNVGMNSIFLFDRLIYTSLEADATGNSTATPTGLLGQASPSPTMNEAAKKHNIATFGGAVGGSAGVLGVFALCLALSIIRRRHLAAKRDRRERRERESLHTNASDDSPHMSGPAPFVPRYFPDTIIPTEPPTYVDALRTRETGSTLLAQLGRDAYPAARSYADIPPESPPPPLDPDAPLIPVPPPPPPFPLSVTIPSVPSAAVATNDSDSVAPSYQPATETSETDNTSVTRTSEGSDSPVTDRFPELTPLIRPTPAVDASQSRPHSRQSIRSIRTTVSAAPVEPPHAPAIPDGAPPSHVD